MKEDFLLFESFYDKNKNNYNGTVLNPSQNPILENIPIINKIINK